MQDYIYSVIAFLAIVIHLIINFNMLPWRRGYAASYGRHYRGFLAGIFAYYVVDAGWGVFAGLGWTHVLYVDTTLYYIAIGGTVVMWSRYVVAYLELDKWIARPLLWFGYALLGSAEESDGNFSAAADCPTRLWPWRLLWNVWNGPLRRQPGFA